ncbi:hypothetical protein C2G38_2148627 [Gigaspora rosea]|uniref:Kinase-like domain-containing protein n=1 Tax=Gigaspora rosea TaxID=44941 RepID=A0A397U4P5_9GLOM|nr:hypothetical protein C2G38_2148627 [Gigaspora rosea]
MTQKFIWDEFFKQNKIKILSHDSFENDTTVLSSSSYKVFSKKYNQIMVLNKVVFSQKCALENFVNNLLQYQRVELHENILKFIGIVKYDIREVIFAHEYSYSGTLRQYLNQNFKLITWNGKLRFAKQLTSAIKCLHENNIVHMNLHSEKIFVHKGDIKISAFKFQDRISKRFKYFPYIDPQCLRNLETCELDKSSDIYSIGVLLWEISSGTIPFKSELPYNYNLLSAIIHGKREVAVFGTPKKYIKIFTVFGIIIVANCLKSTHTHTCGRYKSRERVGVRRFTPNVLRKTKVRCTCTSNSDITTDYNVIINVDESQNASAKVFKTHSAVLRHRSLYFRNELANVDKDKNNIKTLKLKNIPIKQFEIIIKYIYGGVILLENYDASFIFELMIIAYKFLLEELVQYLEAHLIKAESHWLRLHFSRIYRTSFQDNKLQELQKWCNDIVTKYPEKVFDAEDFDSVQENALISLIKRDDLQMDEVKIWNYVIKWGIAQIPNLPSDLENWSQENFQVLRTTLQNFLPLIRYFQMSADDIIDNAEPYKRILEKSLWKDIKKRFMSPNRPITSTILPPRLITTPTLPSRELFSTIISNEHAAEIASWIDKKDDIYSIENNPYDFKLLLRERKFTADSFWNLCDKKENVIVIIKVNGTDEILGGYSPIGWNKPKSWSGKYNSCNECFIFSLNNGIIQDSILSRVKIPEFAIFNCKSYGPCFGGKHNDFDLVMKEKDSCYCRHNSYEKSIRNEYSKLNFSVEECEIFQIHKKTE